MFTLKRHILNRGIYRRWNTIRESYYKSKLCVKYPKIRIVRQKKKNTPERINQSLIHISGGTKRKINILKDVRVAGFYPSSICRCKGEHEDIQGRFRNFSQKGSTWVCLSPRISPKAHTHLCVKIKPEMIYSCQASHPSMMRRACAVRVPTSPDGSVSNRTSSIFFLSPQLINKTA